jgi:uncharacterized protein YbaA (DUF1428 family)
MGAWRASIVQTRQPTHPDLSGQTTQDAIMAKYVDGFVIPIPRKGLAAYRRLSTAAGKVWREHGALEYRECVGDDLKASGLFPRQLKLKRGETVIFAWVVYKSKAHRDRVNKKVMTDPRITSVEMSDIPFDSRRMLYGGFTTIVEL